MDYIHGLNGIAWVRLQ